MDAETLLLLSDCDPALVEDGAFYFRLTQSFGGIPLSDVQGRVVFIMRRRGI